MEDEPKLSTIAFARVGRGGIGWVGDIAEVHGFTVHVVQAMMEIVWLGRDQQPKKPEQTE
jgi:hypothetical protein